jgi:hypothetical protein
VVPVGRPHGSFSFHQRALRQYLLERGYAERIAPEDAAMRSPFHFLRNWRGTSELVNPCTHSMSHLPERLVYGVEFWMQKKFEVARFHGIILADCRKLSLQFERTVLGSLQLICDNDPRRFQRVRRYIQWVLNCPLSPNLHAEYHWHTRTCKIDFQEPEPNDKEPWHRIYNVAFNARSLVHEATHGELAARGIAYTPENRVRAEKLCIMEENRFLKRIEERAKARSDSDLEVVVHHLQREFEASSWEPAWTASRWQQALAVLKQWRSV